MSRLKRRSARVLLAGLAWLSLPGCDRPLEFPPTPAIQTFSSSPFAVDLAFDRPLSRTDAGNLDHYSLRLETGERLVPIRASLVDTLFGETLRLFFPIGTLPDSAGYTVTLRGLRQLNGSPMPVSDSMVVHGMTGLSYDRPIRQLLSRRCDMCHGASAPAGGYRTDSYASLFEFGSDSAAANPIRNLVPGKARSTIVVRTTPRHSMFSRAHLSYEESQLILNWVVTYQARR